MEIIAKGCMVLVTQFTNSISPLYSFPFICAVSAYMMVATDTMKPCCIFWANHIKVAAYALQLWTGVGGMIVFYFWKLEMIYLRGMPLTPVAILVLGWVPIAMFYIKKMKQDHVLLARPKKRQRKGA